MRLDSHLMLALYVKFTFQMFPNNAICLQRSVNKVYLQIIPQVSVLTTRSQVLKFLTPRRFPLATQPHLSLFVWKTDCSSENCLWQLSGTVPSRILTKLQLSYANCSFGQ